MSNIHKLLVSIQNILALSINGALYCENNSTVVTLYIHFNHFGKINIIYLGYINNTRTIDDR